MITNEKTLTLLSMDNIGNFFTNLPSYVNKASKLDKPFPNEAIYEFLKFINENDNFTTYITFGNTYKGLHEDIDILKERILYHVNTDDTDYKELVVEEYNKLPEYLRFPVLGIKYRLTGLFTYLSELEVDSPIYAVDVKYDPVFDVFNLINSSPFA